MKANRVGGMWAAAAALALIVSGCATGGGTESPEGPSDSGQGSAEQPSTLTAEHIAATIEEHDFDCEEKEARMKGREQVVECRADDYVFITATRMSDVGELDKQIGRGHTVLCENDLADGFRHAVSDTWILVPGGDREKDIAAFDTAMSDLGLEWTEELC